jgi:hypothetical protein
MAPAPDPFITEAFKINSQLRVYAWLAYVCVRVMVLLPKKHEAVDM